MRLNFNNSTWHNSCTGASKLEISPPSVGWWLWNRGIARTQSPTNKNDAVELSTFEIIAGVNPTEVQWKGLALGEPPSWSWLTPQPGKYAHETDSLVDTIQFHSNVFGTLTQHTFESPQFQLWKLSSPTDVHKYSITSRTSKSAIFETAIWFRTDLLAKLPKTFWASLQTSFPESALPVLHLWSSTMENRVSTHRFNYSGHGEWVRVLNTKLFQCVLQWPT